MKIKKKLKKFGKGGQNPPIITKDKNDPRIQAYQDSLDLYNYTQKQHQLDRTRDISPMSIFEIFDKKNKFTEEGLRNQSELYNTAQNYLMNNPRLKTGLDSAPRKLPVSTYRKEGSYDIYHDTIKPSSTWFGTGKNSEYQKPVQPIIYQPEDNYKPNWQPSNIIENGRRRIEDLNGRYDAKWEEIKRPKEQPINIQSAKPDLLQGNNQQLEFNPVGFQKGTYFTRPKQGQEIGGLEYFDKKTGRKLFQTGGEFKDPRADSYYTPSNSDTRKDYKLNSESKGTKLNPIVKPEVEIIAKRTKPLGWIGQVANSENTNPYLQTGSGQLASDLFVTPITETLHTPSRLLNQAIGLYKGNHPNYDSEIHQTLGLKENDPTDLWQGVRNFTVDNAADIVAPLAPEAGVKFAKNRALNIIGQHPGHARSFSDILEGTLLNNKREYFGNWGVPERDVYGYGKRDLPKLLIHGDESGFVPINYSDPGMNPNYKTYQMNSAVKHGQPLKWQELANEIKGSNPEFEFHQDFTKDPERFKEMMKELAETKGDKGIIKFDVRPNADYKGLRLSNNPIYPEDDVAGHMGFFDTNKMQWNSRDQWGFTPAYDVRYKTTPFQKLQRQAVEKIGKPFNLAQENPIDFSQISKDYQPRIVHNLNVEGEDFWNNLDKWKQKDYTELLKKDYVKSPKFKELYKKDKREFGGNIELEKINELDMAKNGKKIKMKLKKADIGKFIPTSDGNIYNEFGVEEVPQSLQEDQYDPITGQKFDQFNPALTFGLQNYYQSKGKNAPAYLNNQEANQYADYVNTQPKQQNANNNTFANNVAPNLPTQGLFNNFYLNKADHYRKQAINSFSKLGQARYGKQLPKAQFGGNDYANLGSGIANAVTADINTAKGYTDIFGTLNMNSQIAQIEAQNKRQNLVSQFENPTPIFQNGWGGNNPLDNGYIPVGEYGMSIKEIGEQGQPNIEVEGKEHIQLPNGFSQEIQGNSHADGGIPLNLPQDSKVFSEKLKHPEMKKSYAKMAKKFETKKDFKQLENPISSKLNKSTAELNIKLKNQGLDELFMEQEMNKMEGIHGEIPQKETMKDYEMKYGGSILPKAGNGVLTQEDIDLWKTVKYGDVSKNPKLQEIAKKIRESGLLANAWKDAGITGEPGNDGKGFSDDEILASFNEKNYDLSKFLGNTSNQQPTTQNTTFTGVNPNVDWKTLRLEGSAKQRRDKFLPFKKGELPQGYGSQEGLQSVFNDFENNYKVKLPQGTEQQKLNALRDYQSKLSPELTKDYKLNFARGNNELYSQYAKSKGYKKQKDETKESQNFYDWAKNSGKLGEDYANKGQWGHEYYNTAPLNFNSQEEYDKWTQDPDWKKVGKYYVDRSADPNQPITYYNVNQPKFNKQPAVRDSTIPSTIPSQQAEKLNRLKGFNSNITGLQLPDAYLRDPITVNNLQPEYYQPNTITPYLNDIQRLQYATNTNLGTSGADLASRANSFGQGLTEYGKRYYDASTYNAGVKTQAAKDNALTKLNTNQFNNSNYINNARNPQLQREAVITEQKRLDKEAQLKTFADKEHEQMVMNYLGDIYDPNYALNANFSNPSGLKSASVESEEAKKARAYETLYGKKYGGKIKLKPKRKK